LAKEWSGLEAEIVSDALGDLEPVLASLSETEERANELEEQLSASNEVIQQLSDILNRFPESDVLAVIETIREENHPSEP
jgi:DNA-binding transcriptional regulator GbsR (MarR family)